MQKPDENSGFAKSMREVGPYLGLGLQLAATIVGFVLIGSWMDKKYDSSYLYTIIGGLLGISLGIYNLIKTVNDLDKRSKNADKK